MANSKFEYVKSFEVDDRLMPHTWIVVRIDGCNFHRFSEVHEFDKPNDEQALKLMNSCAASLLEEIPDIVFAYGVSDEYRGTQTQEKNELLFQQFGINYNTLPAIFRKGSCVFKDRVEETVKVDDNGNPVKRRRKKVVVAHCDVIGPNFWKEHPDILGE